MDYREEDDPATTQPWGNGANSPKIVMNDW